MSNSVALSKVVDKMKLENLTPEIDISGKKVITTEVNRPALQLTGFFDHFESERVQIIGYVEYTYLQYLTREQRLSVYEKLLSYKIPCLIYTTLTTPDPDMIELAKKYEVPIFVTKKPPQRLWRN